MYTQITLNIHEPQITMIVGTRLLPKPREAAIVQSMNPDIQYDKANILSLFIPASITSSSDVNKDKNSFPKATNNKPKIIAIATEYIKLIK